MKKQSLEVHKGHSKSTSAVEEGRGGSLKSKRKRTRRGGGQDFLFVCSVKQIARFFKQQTVLSDKLLGSC